MRHEIIARGGVRGERAFLEGEYQYGRLKADADVYRKNMHWMLNTFCALSKRLAFSSSIFNFDTVFEAICLTEF